MMSANRQLSPGETAARIGVSVETVRRWRASGEGPRFNSLPGGSVRYPESVVTSWLESGEELSA